MKATSRFAVAVLLLLPVSLAFAGGEDWKKQFKKNMSSPDSGVRFEAVRQLDANDSAALKEIIKVLQIQDPKVTDWHIRRGAIEALAKAENEKSVKTILKELQKGKPLVREAVATALGQKKDPEYLDALVEALADKSTAVRRAAIRSLSGIKDKRVIDALLEYWPQESPSESFRQWALCKEALEGLTGKYIGREPLDWKNWWEAHRERFSFEEEWEDEEQAERERQKAEEEGRKAKEHKTQTSNVPLSFKVRGIGAPLLVLPRRGWHEDYFQPYLQGIEDICKVHYVRLPAPTDFKGVEKGAGGIPFYPVDKLVDAFEELRQQFKYKRFAIMTHGLTSTVAQRYASKYPDSVSHIIMVGAYAGSDSYGQILKTMEETGRSRGDLELEHLAQSLQIIDQEGNHKYEPKDADEGRALGRKLHSLFFRNPHDMVVYEQFARYQLQGQGGGTVIFPKFDTFKEKRARTPTLIINGKDSLWTSVSDAQKISKHYPNSVMYIFDKSTMMPFVEETEKFTSVVHKFFKTYRVKSG